MMKLRKKNKVEKRITQSIVLINSAMSVIEQ